MKIAVNIFVFMAIVTLLIIGKNFILPILLAGLVWFVIKELRQILFKIPFAEQIIPNWLMTLIASVLFVFILSLIISILSKNLLDININISKYEKNFNVIKQSIITKYGIDVSSLFSNFIGNYNFTNIIEQILNSFSNLLSQSLLIGFYVLFLFFEEKVFTGKIKLIYNDSKKYSEIKKVLSQINQTTSKFIFIKTLISFLTGGLSFVILYFIGIDTPFFWAFLIFVLYFIPVIGPVISTIIPALVALLQFGELNYLFLTLGLITFVQIFIQNYLEPKIFGDLLNMSPFFLFLTFTFWGMIWGMAGMFLSVPVTVILIILLAQFKTTKPIAILLSDKGKV